MQAPTGQEPPPYAPAPSGNKFPWLILVFVLGAGVMVFGVLAALAFFGFQRYMARARAAAARTSTATALSMSYAPGSRLATAHYPPEFAAKNLDGSTILLDHNLGFGDDEAVLLAAVRDPISDDVNEFARVLLLANQKHIASEGGTYRELSHAPSACFRGLPGVEVSSEATLSDGKAMRMWTCFFMHNGHGYEIKTMLPVSRIASEGPLLSRIAAATELTD